MRDVPCALGDVLRRTCAGPVDHFGVYLGDAFGGVLDIQKLGLSGRAAVRVCAFDEFAAGKPVYVADRLSSGGDIGPVLRRAEHLLAAGTVRYSILGGAGPSFNCEHVARWILRGVAWSAQAMAGWAVVIAIALLLLVIVLARA